MIKNKSQRSPVYHLLTLLIVLCVVGVVYLYIAPQTFVLNNFRELEDKELQIDLSRINSAIEQEIRRVTGIEYIYKDEDTEIDYKFGIQFDSLEHIPSSLLTQLYYSVENGDVKLMNSFVNSIETYDLSLSKKLKELTENYDYDSRISLLSKGVSDENDAEYNGS